MRKLARRNKRVKKVPSYRLLFFRGNQLESWEEFEADGPMEAMEFASRRPAAVRAELWADGKRFAAFRPAGGEAAERSPRRKKRG